MATRVLTLAAGAMLVVASIVGACLTLAGLAGLGPVTTSIQSTALSTAVQLQRTLTVTSDGLATIDTSLVIAREVAATLKSTLNATSGTLSDTTPLMEGVGDIVGTDVVRIVTTVESSLVSAQASAAGVDGLVEALANVPLLNLGSIKPERPLADSINDVVVSLAPLPAQLIDVQRRLQATQLSMADIERSLGGMSTAVGRIDGTLVEARIVVRQYVSGIVDLQRQWGGFVDALPGWFGTLRVVVAGGLIWFGVAQVGLFTQGLELMARARRKRAGGAAGAAPMEEYG